MNWKEKLAALYKEARALADKSEKGDLSEAEDKRWGELRTEITEAKSKFEEQEARESDAKEFRSGDDQYNKGTGSAARKVTEETRKAGEQNGEKRVKALAPGAKLIESPGFEEFRKSGFAKGKNSGPVDVGSFFHRDVASVDGLRDVTGLDADELRTLIYTGAFPIATGSPSFVAPNRLPGVYTPDMPELNVRSAFLNLQTSSPVIQFFRELVFTNAAAFVIEATATGGSSGTKAESALTFESDSVVAEIIAHFFPVSNNTLEDFPQMRGIIEGRLIDGLKMIEDEGLINGTGVSPQVEGLAVVSGTQEADAAYWGANPVENAGTAWEDFDRITRARTLVRITGRARPSFILMSPADLERLTTITDNNGQYYSGSPFGSLALTSMRGLRVIETEALDEGNAWVGDGRMAAVFDRMSAAVTAGWINDDFIRNKIALLAEERLAFAVFRPAAFVHVELTSI